MQFYFIDDNKRKGPFTIDELKSLEFNGNTLFWHEGLEDWIEAKKIKQIKKLLKPSEIRKVSKRQKVIFTTIASALFLFLMFYLITSFYLPNYYYKKGECKKANSYYKILNSGKYKKCSNPGRIRRLNGEIKRLNGEIKRPTERSVR